MDFFDYFQISVLILFYLVFIGRAVQMALKGANPFVLGKGKKGLDAVLEISFFFGLIMWTIEIVTHSLGLGFHIFPAPLYGRFFDAVMLRTLGTILISAGFVLFVLSLVSFGESWRVGIDRENAGRLVTGGMFSMTRNPIFLFIDMYFVGTWLIYPNLFFGIFAVLTVVGVHGQILQEEKFLESEYGAEYQQYMEKVRRYF